MEAEKIKYKLTTNDINLFIVLGLVIILFLHFVFPAFSVLEHLRFFSNSSSFDILNKLIPLRLSAAFIFAWYSIDNYEHPQVFSGLMNNILKKYNIIEKDLNLLPVARVQSCIEMLVALSLATGIFLDAGSLIGVILLTAVLIAYELGPKTFLVRDVSILGALMTVFLLSIN